MTREIFKKLIGEKKVEIIEFLAQNCDENDLIALKISEICQATNSSKPTAINTIKMLEEHKIIAKIKNGLYKITL